MSWILLVSASATDSPVSLSSSPRSSDLRLSRSPYPSTWPLDSAMLASRSEISESSERTLLREFDLLPRLDSHMDSADDLAAGRTSPPGTVRNLLFTPPSVTTFSSSRSEGVIANTLRYRAGSSVPVGMSGRSPSTVFWTSLRVLSSPSCSYVSVPESVLSLEGYWFLLDEGTSVDLMNSITVVFPLSLGPWRTVRPSEKQ